MIPRRFRNWLLFWTPVTWLVLALCTYPKDLPIIIDPQIYPPGEVPEASLSSFIGGFFAPTIANYPAWVMVSLAVLAITFGVLGLTRRGKARMTNILLVVMGGVFAVWAVDAGGGLGEWQSRARLGEHGWFFQTIVVVLGALCIYFWARANPERAVLTTWNTHQVWQLYRANWQGMAGLYIMLFFLLMALLAPFLADHMMLDPNSQVSVPYDPPSSPYYLWSGTDQVGQSVLAEFIWSARISLAVGLLATAISTVLGAGIGIAAGFYGGWQSEVWMRITDGFLVIPWLPLAMVLAAAWGQNFWMIIVIIGITSWPGTARVVRSDTLRIREMQFIERARAIGSSNRHIMGKHVLPNAFPLIFANTILVVAIAILSETTLSFLGLGDPLNFSWGTMLHYAWANGAAGLPAWWYLLPPGIAIVLIVVAFTFMGTAFDEVLDPKLRKREESGSADRFSKSPKVAIPTGAMGMGTVITQGLDEGHPVFGHEADKGGDR